MQTIARLRYLNIAPRKVRLVTRLIKGKTAKEAAFALRFTVRRAARPILKLLQSAIANAKQNFQIEESNLYVRKINVNGGPIRKKWRARARGSAARIEKRTSHVDLFLEQIEEQKKTNKKGKVEVIAKTVEEKEATEKITTRQKPKFQADKGQARPNITKANKKVFRRKAF